MRLSQVIIASILIGLIALSPAASSAAKTELLLNGRSIQLNQNIIFKNSRAFIPLRSLSDHMGFLTRYHSSSRSVSLIRPNLHIQLPLNSPDVVINGIKIKNEDLPFIKNGTTYVPIRFLSNVMKTKLDWSKEKNQISLKGEQFAMYSDVRSNYWVSFDSGEVYYSEGGTVHKLDGASVTPLSQGTLQVHHFDENTSLLTVDDERGSHMTIFHNRFQFLLRDNSVVRQAHFNYSGSYSSKNFQLVPSSDQKYLSDGSSLLLLNANGNMAKELHLAEITGETGSHIIEYATSGFALVRPSQSLHLILIDLKDETSVVLYQKLLEEHEQKFWEQNIDATDPLYVSSQLKFTKQQGNMLYFEYASPINTAKKTVTYPLQND